MKNILEQVYSKYHTAATIYMGQLWPNINLLSMDSLSF